MIKSILIPTENKIGVNSICKDSTFGLGQIILKRDEECFYNTHKSGGSVTTPWKRNLNGRLSNYDIILIDTEAEIVEGSQVYFGEHVIEIMRISIPDDSVTFFNPLDGKLQTINGLERFKLVISSTNKSHNLPQLSPESIQLLINHYNEHKCMPESVEVEDDLTLNKGDLAINPFTGKADNILGILKDKDCVFFENSDTPYSIKSVKLAQPNIKLNQQGEVDITIPEVKEKLYTEEEMCSNMQQYLDEYVFTNETYITPQKWLNSKKK